MVTRRAVLSPVGQALPWLVAALLVVAGSGFIALWLNTTAHNADIDSLARGADAVESNVEEQLRILELAGSGTMSLAGESIADLDLSRMVSSIDMSLMTSLLDVIIYPMDEAGVGSPEHLIPEFPRGFGSAEVDVPDIDLSWEEYLELIAAGDYYYSTPFPTSDPGRLDYLVGLPKADEGGSDLVGVVFRPDRLLTAAVDAAGGEQYAVDLVDVRYDDQVVVSLGSPVGSLETRRSPEGIDTAFGLIVRPGEEFRFAQSPWVTRVVYGIGLLVASLLVVMGWLARSRSRELTERLRLAQELNESKDRFLAAVSHELRTPLTVVLGVAEEMGPNWQRFSDTDRNELMTMMTDQAVEASNIVEDLLVAARSDPSQLRLAMENTHLLSHVEFAVKSLPDEARRRVTSHAHDHLVWADTTRLRQILRNLLENAVRYGGDEITVECELDGKSLNVIVSDNGDGFAEADAERIFEPYEQSRDATAESPSGVGIGLYVSRLLARLMDGDLDCVREGGLTRFRLRLTIGQPQQAAGKRQMVAAS